MQYSLGMSPASDPVQSPPILSREFLKRAERVKASSDPDQATAQTIQIMCGHIAKAAADPLVQQCAVEGVKQWRGGFEFASTGRDPWGDPLAIAESIWWWCKHSMRFVHHSKQILVWLGERDQLQLLIAPDVLVRMRSMEGDCAIYTMMICSMLTAMGIDWEIETLSTNPTKPDIFNHVFLRVVLPDGRRIPFDCSHGEYPGWRVPLDQVLRSQVWDESGAAIPDEAAYQGLHSYLRNPNPWWNMGGLGQDSSSTDSSSVDLGASMSSLIGSTGYVPTDPTGFPTIEDLNAAAQTPLPSETVVPGTNINAAPTSAGTYSTQVNGQPAIIAPSQSSAAWAAFATAATKAGLQLATLATIQPGTAVLPNGTIVTSGPYGIPAVGSIGSAFGTINSGTIVLAAGGLFALILVMNMMRGR